MKLRRCRQITLLSLVWTTFAVPALAGGQTDAGRVIATSGTAAGVPACGSCHGADGEGQPGANIPRLAGMDPGYLRAQLAAFKVGSRANDIMGPIAGLLDARSLDAVTDYYARLSPKTSAPTRPNAPGTAGHRLARDGDWSANIPPCASCHGADGSGVGETFPPLAGQPAGYLRARLRSMKAGGSAGDPQGLMKTIATRLSDAQIEAVATYFEAVPVTGEHDVAGDAPSGRDPEDFAQVVRLGEAIFRNPSRHARNFVGNELTCASCHLDAGRLKDSAPLAAAYVKYPAFRAKNGHVNTFEERLQGCFRYSMNGKPPPLGSNVLVALQTYAFSLAKGVPTGADVPGRGYPRLPKPASAPSFARGGLVYAQRCAVCHGGDGAGRRNGAGAVFPALWGATSFNWGAGMGSVANAAGFIKANMPLGQGGTLSNQDAWDVAMFVDGHERPQDPRYTGDVAATRAKFHPGDDSLYGTVVDGVLLGEKAPPAGPHAGAK